LLELQLFKEFNSHEDCFLAEQPGYYTYQSSSFSRQSVHAANKSMGILYRVMGSGPFDSVVSLEAAEIVLSRLPVKGNAGSLLTLAELQEEGIYEKSFVYRCTFSCGTVTHDAGVYCDP
jgi:hypothetical protein